MFSRAHLLIEKEYEQFVKDPPWGIEAHPLTEDNVFEWGAKIKGLKDTLWEGGIFRVYVKFDENFNLRPPKVCFHTVPFHPNVDMITGQPCIEILDRWEVWKESYSLSFVLLAVQAMLSNPSLQSPVNVEAAEMIRCSPHSYRQMVLDCVAASQRVEAGLSPQLGEESIKVRFAPTDDKPAPLKMTTMTAPVRISKLSFEDYHSTWCGIATSKTRPEMVNPFLESIQDNPSLQAAHIGLNTEEIQEQMTRQVEEHNTLFYGQVKGKLSDQEERAAKIDKLNKMKKIYLPPRKPPPTPVHESSAHASHGPVREEPWEREVDDLVAWSSKLDSNLIDV